MSEIDPSLRFDGSPRYYSPDGEPMTLFEWGSLFELRRLDPDDSWWRRRTEVGDTVVSTVWMGLDHNWSPDGPPLTWETMIFEGEHDDECWRYSTREQAFAAHDQIVAALREGNVPIG